VAVQLVRQANLWGQLPCSGPRGGRRRGSRTKGPAWRETSVVCRRYFCAESALDRAIRESHGKEALPCPVQNTGTGRLADERHGSGSASRGLCGSVDGSRIRLAKGTGRNG